MVPRKCPQFLRIDGSCRVSIVLPTNNQKKTRFNFLSSNELIICLRFQKTRTTMHLHTLALYLSYVFIILRNVKIFSTQPISYVNNSLLILLCLIFYLTHSTNIYVFVTHIEHLQHVSFVSVVLTPCEQNCMLCGSYAVAKFVYYFSFCFGSAIQWFR